MKKIMLILSIMLVLFSTMIYANSVDVSYSYYSTPYNSYYGSSYGNINPYTGYANSYYGSNYYSNSYYPSNYSNSYYSNSYYPNYSYSYYPTNQVSVGYQNYNLSYSWR